LKDEDPVRMRSFEKSYHMLLDWHPSLGLLLSGDANPFEFDSDLTFEEVLNAERQGDD
jgi:hypothetical protein